MITLEIGVSDLAASRFAISPLSETLTAILRLADPARTSVNAPWVRWAQAELAARPARLTRLWPLVVNGLDTFPEFLVPAPAVRAPDFDDELARLRATPAEAVRGSLTRVFSGVPWPPSAVELSERTGAALAAVGQELRLFHERMIAPYWTRMRAVLEADIAYRASVLASGGARALFGDLHPALRWHAGVLTIGDSAEEVRRAALGPDGVVLVPGVFTWPEVSTRLATSSQTTLHYPARAAATVWFRTASSGLGNGDPGTAPVGDLLGAARARLLGTLRSPATTTSLAQALGVTPGAVSQQLAVLYRNGLVDRARSGRTVMYQATDLGLTLLDQPGR